MNSIHQNQLKSKNEFLSKNAYLKMSKLQTFDDDASFMVEEQAIVSIGEGEDIEKLKKLKEVSQRFLEVNNFDISNEPKIEDLSTDQFISYIEKNNESNIVIAKLDELNIDISFRSSMSNFYSHKDIPNNKIFVFFLPENKKNTSSVSFNEIKKFITLIFKLDCKEGLMVSFKELSPISAKHISQCNINQTNCYDIYNIITYKDDNFIDLTKHAFIPEVLEIYRAGEEAEKFGRENKISVSKLSRQPVDDPLSKFYRGKVGDIFKLRRKNIAQKSILTTQIVYRIIVPSVYK